MTKKENKQARAVAPAPKKKNTQPKRNVGPSVPRPLKKPSIHPFTRCLIDPFNAPPCHIPDPDVQPSGILTSRGHYVGNAANSGTSTNHSWGFVFLPYPRNCAIGLGETTAGNSQLTDLNAAGTAVNNLNNATNIGTFQATSSKVRCTGIGVRIIYEGTELNRGARFFGGNIPITANPFSVATTGTFLSVLTALGNGVSQSTGGLRNQMQTDMFETRTPGEGVIEFFWKPGTVPTYQTYNNSALPNINASGSTVQTITTTYNAPAGQLGTQFGQNALVVVCEGDTTPSATSGPNTYEVEAIWHWEVVPDNINGVAYDVSASYCSAAELDEAFNVTSRMAPGRIVSGSVTVGGVNAGMKTGTPGFYRSQF